MKKIIFSLWLGVWLVLVTTLALAQLNPNQPYATVANACGGVYYLQGSTYYDTHGNSYSTLPSCTPVIPHGVTVLAQSAVPVSVTGTTSETTLATISIPAGVAAVAGGKLRVIFDTTQTGNANTKTGRVRLGGQSVWFGSGAFGSATGTKVFVDILIVGPASQKTMTGITTFFGSGASAGMTLSTVDMTQPQVLTITGMLGTSTDTFQLEDYSVELLNQ